MIYTSSRNINSIYVLNGNLLNKVGYSNWYRLARSYTEASIFTDVLIRPACMRHDMPDGPSTMKCLFYKLILMGFLYIFNWLFKHNLSRNYFCKNTVRWLTLWNRFANYSLHNRLPTTEWVDTFFIFSNAKHINVLW